MSRMLSVVLVLLLSLVGCSKTASPPKKDTLSLSTIITYLDNEYKADIFASAADVYKIEFTAPEKIHGLCFKWDVDKGAIEYKKLEYKFTESDAPEIFKNIKSAFDLLFLNTENFSLNSDGTYSLSDGNIKIDLDIHGIPIKIETNGIIVNVDTKTP